jgi:oligopeptidase B
MTARHLFLVLTSLLALASAAAAGGSKMDSKKPPVAKIVHTEKTVNGVTLVDDYAWLREKKDPQVTAYLKAENAYTKAYMAPTQTLQKKLYDEMLSHIKQTDVGVPYKCGEYYYYKRTEKGKQYPIVCRKKGSPSAPENVILDVNLLARGQKFMALGSLHVSEDGNLLAYSTDNTGYRQYLLQVKDLRNGTLLPDRAEKTGSLVWANDNKTIFYTVEDAAKRQYRLYKHKLGTDSKADELVLEEKDERFDLSVHKTCSRKYLLLGSNSHTTSEYRYLSADNPDGQWQVALPRKQDIEYYLDHGGDKFYLRINDTGRNFRLVSTPVGSFAESSWQELIPARKDTMLEEVSVFKDFYAVQERAEGLPRLRIIRISDGFARTIPVPEPTYDISPDHNAEFDTAKFRYSYESLVTPESVYDFDVASGESTLLKREEVPGGYDQSLYECERVFATTSDGTRIPISLVYRKDKKTAGKNPLFLRAYGSYGMPMWISFSPSLLSLLDRGVVVAKAHIRGGGDMGKPWHDAGRMMNKKNTFSDFVAATEFLTKAGYGDPGRVGIEGASAGGLLMGAVVNMRPDLFRAVIMGVPFVDVINTMLDTSLPLTVGEFEEWGNPQEKKAFDYMLSYSPYDNLAARDYPAMLVRTSLNDSQVGYWEPAKYVARLRTLKTDKNILLLETNMNAGHGGASGRYEHLREAAFEYAFLLKELGVESGSGK